MKKLFKISLLLAVIYMLCSCSTMSECLLRPDIDDRLITGITPNMKKYTCIDYRGRKCTPIKPVNKVDSCMIGAVLVANNIYDKQ